jgi:ElaB/YqjD/DUF883 family membrane-anchored ribosome-binding protein
MAERNIEKDIDALRGDFASLQADLQTLTKTLARRAKSAASDTADDLLARGRDGMAAVEGHVAERPLASLLIAFGAGVALGKLLDR